MLGVGTTVVLLEGCVVVLDVGTTVVLLEECDAVDEGATVLLEEGDTLEGDGTGVVEWWCLCGHVHLPTSPLLSSAKQRTKDEREK